MLECQLLSGLQKKFLKYNLILTANFGLHFEAHRMSNERNWTCFERDHITLETYFFKRHISSKVEINFIKIKNLKNETYSMWDTFTHSDPIGNILSRSWRILLPFRNKYYTKELALGKAANQKNKLKNWTCSMWDRLVCSDPIGNRLSCSWKIHLLLDTHNIQKKSLLARLRTIENMVHKEICSWQGSKINK